MVALLHALVTAHTLGQAQNFKHLPLIHSGWGRLRRHRPNLRRLTVRYDDIVRRSDDLRRLTVTYDDIVQTSDDIVAIYDD